MRIVTYEGPDGPRAGVIRSSEQDALQVVDLSAGGLAHSVKELLAGGKQSLAAAEKLATSNQADIVEAPRLLAPIPGPQKIICVGLNYADHAAETGATVGNEPIIFCKFPTALRGPDDPIELPAESEQVDYEAELVVVIGETACQVTPADAARHIAGVCCGNDVSARDWQKGKPGGQWLLGKSFDSFAPIGPWLATGDEALDFGNLGIQLRLNGEVMQSSSTNQLIFSIDYLISYLSHVCTLTPGDLIFTGTPPGVGAARKPPLFLKPGDIVEVEIEGLGTLRNPVVAR